MKNLNIILFFLIIVFTASAQKKSSNEISMDDIGRIGFFTDVMLADKDFDGRALQKVKQGLDRMLLKESMGKSIDERFGLVAKPIIYSKEKTSTTPPKYFYEFGIDIIAIDYQEKTKYGVYSYDGLTGMNANSQRALMSGLKKFKSNRGFSEFIEEVKQKIIDFYESNCDFIITDAETNASNDNFDESLKILASIPKVCKSCYDIAQEKLREIYVKKLERECQSLVAEASSLIASEEWEGAAMVLKKVLPGISCHAEAIALIEKVEAHWCGVNLGKAKAFQQSKNFNEAAQYLSLVPTTSTCAEDANNLGKNIYSELTVIEKRDWDFKMQQYDDVIQLEQRNFDFTVNKFEREADRADRELTLNDKKSNKKMDYDYEISKRGADRADRELTLNDKRINKKMDYDFEKRKIIQKSIVDVAKVKANKTTTKITKDYSFLN